MPTFKNAENKTQSELVPDGDYVFCVVDFEQGLSSGDKTNGATMFELTLELENTKAVIYENLIDHESTGWKLDTFLKSCGIQLKEGQAYEFRSDLAEQAGVTWVNPIGLRGWCRIETQGYTPKGATAIRKVNKVATYYTDREKLPRRAIGDEAVSEEDQPF
jgi:hypothetical protein